MDPWGMPLTKFAQFKKTKIYFNTLYSIIHVDFNPFNDVLINAITI